MAGNRGPMMVFPPGFDQANIQPPKLSPEEERRRKALMESIRRAEKELMLKKCDTVDKSGPIVSGECMNAVKSRLALYATYACRYETGINKSRVFIISCLTITS